MSDLNGNPEAEGQPAPEFRTLGGRSVVLGMLGFGVLMVAAMWLYWEAYTRPFRPLQNAINAEYPGSSPRVIGGRHKSHKEGSPNLLRIVIYVDFDPETAEQSTLDEYVERLHTLAAEHLDLSGYDQLEIHLAQRLPEEKTRQRSFAIPLSRRERQPPSEIDATEAK